MVNQSMYDRIRGWAEREFASQGIDPASGSSDRIAREILSGQRTRSSVESDIQWVSNYLANNPDQATDPGGHSLVQSSPSPTVTPAPLSGGGGGEDDSFTVPPNAADLFPFLPGALVSEFINAWSEYGDPQLALAQVRQSPSYNSFFPGIKRDDGTLRMTEQEYLSTREFYRTEGLSYGLDTATIDRRAPELISRGVSPDEFGRRLETLYTQLATNIDEVRQVYAEEYGINPSNLSFRALFNSAVDPDLNPVELENRIRRSQIRGEARFNDLEVSAAEAGELAEFGFDQQAARSFFQRAARTLPTLGRLIERHGDPDDDFSLDEFTDALVFADPEQQARIERLFASEEALFSGGGLFRQTEPGIVAGLEER